jgi:eukaryotic-like serine/threonine-protein kinase
MTPERYQQIKEVFQAALECDTAGRSLFIADACNADPVLKTEVEQLIASYEKADEFIDQFTDEAAKLRLITPDHPVTGYRIGAYEMVDVIGRGGMGMVYLATRADDQYRKQVAIKLIKRGMDTDLIVRRFLGERQILANLNHPNIARLLDGGTTEDDLPYFVMEYIEGLPIDRYCDIHKLSTIERLKLFGDVCSAVQYAHQNLIIHRDIKPGNILVDQSGAVKLLDFGIAKLLGTDISFETLEVTATALRMMTPEYASPEQLRGLAVTTATDVYSLGTVLYELLTGHRPYRIRNGLPAEIAQAISHNEPERPSTVVGRVEEVESPDGKTRLTITPESVGRARSEQPERLRRRLSGDLDNIVLMAMRKDPLRRYNSVEQFSEDIRRYVEGRPILARKDTFTYRSAKFINRNRLAVAAAFLIALTLLAGIVATGWQASLARTQRAIAEQRFNDVRQLANAVLFKYHDAIENLPGATPAREMLVRDALDYLDRLNQAAAGDASLQRELAAAYLKVGDVQGKRYVANLGDTAGAMQSYRKAETILEQLSAANSSDINVQLDLSRAYENIGNLLASSLKGTEAVTCQKKALAIRQTLLSGDPSSNDYNRLLSTSYLYLGDAMGLDIVDSETTLQNSLKRLEVYRKSLAIREEIAATDPANLQTRRELAQICQRLGSILTGVSFITGNGDDLRLAIETSSRALEIREQIARIDPTNARDRRQMADQQMLLSESLADIGDISKAMQGYRKAEVIFESLSAVDPTNAEARRDIANLNERIGVALAKKGDLGAAIKNQRKAARIFEELQLTDPTRAEDFASAMQAYLRLSELLLKKGELNATVEACNRARAIIEATAKNNPAEFLLTYRAIIDDKTVMAYATFASRNAIPTDSRLEYWIQARNWYQRSLDTRLLQQRNYTGNQPFHAEINRLTSEIAKCDMALAKRP